MSCQERSDSQLWEYLDDELPGATRLELERHIAECALCQGQVEQMRRRPLVLGQQRLAAPPPDFHRRVMARVAAELPPRLRSAELRWLAPLLDRGRLMAASAAALTLALLSVAVVGAVLAMPAVETAVPAAEASMANSMLLAMRQALLPLGPFFHDWGWFVLALGMLAAIMMPGVRALVGRLQSHL